jgi:hypothetical protein
MVFMIAAQLLDQKNEPKTCLPAGRNQDRNRNLLRNVRFFSFDNLILLM